MTCTVERAALAAALSSALSVASRSRDASPILRMVKIAVVRGNLVLSATDTKHWLDTHVEGNGDLEPVCVNAALLSGIVASFPAETLSLAVDGGTLTIKGGKGWRKLPTLAAQDFPTREFEPDITITLPAKELAEAINFTLPHIAGADVSRWYLAGVHFFSDEGRLKVVGTDGNELGVFTLAETAETISATISPKLAEIAAQIKDGDVELSFNERGAQVRWSGGCAIGPLISDFPIQVVQRALADQWERSAVVDAKELLRALKAVHSLGEMDGLSSSYRVKMTLNGTAELSVASQSGSAVQGFEADWDQPATEIGFASARMERIMRSFGDRVVNIGIRDPASPMKIEAAGLTDRTALLFPLRI